MADPHPKHNPTSPISQLLKTLGMTREDLVQHTEQMRAHLSQPDLSQHVEVPGTKTRSLQRSRTASLSNLATRTLSPTPPMTPVKAEPVEHSIPPRQMDTMQLVMERKSRQAKRERRDSLSRSRDSRRVSTARNPSPSRSATPSHLPTTPHHYKYYSDRVIGEASGSQMTLNSYLDGVAPPETPSRGGSRTAAQFKLPDIRPPKTPVSRHIRQYASSSRASTPGSSPARVVNQVSSPGPMRPAPEEDLDDLPYTLPAGPYSKVKPDFSYAAMIGQAILSSPDHRLTLQDIYEWITTVYPFYSRNEQTWMNSIRHSLSTMAVFRKVTRGRNEGKSLWAIWDCDLPCFANGGFRKTLCADMIKSKTHQPVKSGPKRKPNEDTLPRDAKKRKKSVVKQEAITSLAPVSMFTAPVLPPFYAPAYSNVQQQSYYQASYIPQTMSTDIIFPPLPPTSSYHRAHSMSTAASRPTTADSMKTAPSVPSTSALSEPNASKESTPEAPMPSSSQEKFSSSSSVPELVGSSYSSPPLSSDTSLPTADIAPEDDPNADIVDPEDEVDRLTAQWLASPSVLDSLEPLHNTANQKMTTPGSAKSTKDAVRNYLARTGALPVPDSPTMNRRSAKGKGRMRSLSPGLPPLRMVRAPSRPITPPRRPCTPPRKRVISGSALQLSALDTPISHRGLHMSPSPSLAHYKSHLDPPPAAVFHPHAPLLTALTASDDASLTLPSPTIFRTPSRKRTSQKGDSDSRPHGDFSPFAPLTPRRLAFVQDSPFRLAHFIDPHDPSVMLDDELRRLDDKAQLEDSPIGNFFGKRALYESPGLTSPSRYW